MKTNLSLVLGNLLICGLVSAVGQTPIIVPKVQPTPIPATPIVIPQVQPTPIVRPVIVQNVVQPTPIPATPIYRPVATVNPIVVPQVQATPVLQLPSPGNPAPAQATTPTSTDANPRRASFFSLPAGLNRDNPFSAEQWNNAVFGLYRLDSPF